jgi:hypothetical protein
MHISRPHTVHSLRTSRGHARALHIGVLVGVLWVGLGIPRALAQAEQGSFDVEQPFETTAADPCGTGEVVFIEGILHQWGHFTQNAAGGFDLTVHLRLEDVLATGLTTGAPYQYSEHQTISVQSQTDGFPFLDTQLVNFRLRGPSGAFHVRIQAHITINNTGDVTADHGTTTVHCL